MYNSTNIEYSHFYTSKGIGPEQLKSKKIVSNLLDQQKANSTLTILVDDRPAGCNNLSVQSIKTTLSVSDRAPDWIIKESALEGSAEQLITLIPEQLLRFKHSINHETICSLKLGRDIIRLWKGDNSQVKQFSCAALTATWLLCRLGEINLPAHAALASSTSTFAAEEALTVLHERYKPVELQAHRIIEQTNFAHALKRINYIYFQ